MVKTYFHRYGANTVQAFVVAKIMAGLHLLFFFISKVLRQVNAICDMPF